MTGVSAHSGTVSYAYDTKDRLLSESSTRLGGYSQSHAYDGAGNPTTLRGATASFNADNQRTGTGYAYDGDGNPTTYAGTGLGFDPECHLTSLGSGWGAGYRADGLRGWKSVSGTKTYYLYDAGVPVVEMDASGSVTAANVYAPNGLVARIVGSTATQYAFDPQGNVAQRLDASGSVLSSSIYDAYGQESSTGTPTDPFGFNAQWGYVTDRETSLCYCQSRYYDAANGRWLNRDTIGAAGGINVYGYCEGGPVGADDTSGRNMFGPPEGGEGGGGGEWGGGDGGEYAGAFSGGLGGGPGGGIGGGGEGGGEGGGVTGGETGGGVWMPESAPVNYPQPIGPPVWSGPGPQEWGGNWPDTPSDVSNVYGPPTSVPDPIGRCGRGQLRWDLGNRWNITWEQHPYDGWYDEGNPIWERHHYGHFHLNGPGDYHSWPGGFPGDALPPDGPLSPVTIPPTNTNTI